MNSCIPVKLLRLFLLTAGLVGTCKEARTQGAFQFANLNAPYGVNAPVFDSGGNPLAGSRYRAALYVGLTESSLQAVADAPFLSGSTAGYFSGGVVRVSGVNEGIMTWVQVKAWDTALGSTVETVKARELGGYGESHIFTLTAGGGGTLPTLPAPLIGLESFSLLPVIPEPSTLWIMAGGLPFLFLAAAKQGRTNDGS